MVLDQSQRWIGIDFAVAGGRYEESICCEGLLIKAKNSTSYFFFYFVFSLFLFINETILSSLLFFLIDSKSIAWSPIQSLVKGC